MYRKPLRGTTGCARCRLRRKKCDEEKPRCGYCCKHDLICEYERATSVAIADCGFEEAPSASLVKSQVPVQRLARSTLHKGPKSGLGSSGYVAFRDQAQFDLVFQSPLIFRGLITQPAGKEFDDLSILATLAIQHRCIRNALEAYTAFSLLPTNPNLRDHAAWTYQRAITDLRERLDAVSSRGVGIDLLVTITFLGVIESLCIGNADSAVIHFSAAAALCKSLPSALLHHPSSLSLYRIAVECWLFNLSTLALFCTKFDTYIRSIDWGIVDQVFNRRHTTQSCAHDISPFFGGNHTIYRLVLVTAVYMRSPHSPDSRRQQARVWSQELAAVEGELTAYYKDLPREVADLYYWKYMLHVHALSILLLKIEQPSSTTAHQTIRKHVQSAETIFTCKNTRENRNPSLAWPLAIFLCAAHEEPTFEAFVEIVHQIGEQFGAGHTVRLSALLDIVRRCRGPCQSEQPLQYHTCKHNSLNLLTRKDGILSSGSSTRP